MEGRTTRPGRDVRRRANRLAAGLAAVCALALSSLLSWYALYVATGRDTIFTGALAALELVLAFGSLAGSAVGAFVAFVRPEPGRAWWPLLVAAVCAALWFAFVGAVSGR